MDITEDQVDREPRPGRREDIELVALQLLEKSGTDAVTTRGVGAAAGVQPTTIYRIFGDRAGLLGAVVRRGVQEYLIPMRDGIRAEDAVDRLREGWDRHVRFGLDHPHLYTLMYGNRVPGEPTTAVTEAADLLHELVDQAAAEGRLTMPPGAAAELVHAACCGATLSLLTTPTDERDMGLSARSREAIITAVTADAPEDDDDRARLAVTLAATLRYDAAGLTVGEQHLLKEWLERLAFR